MWRLKKILVFHKLPLQPEIVPATKYPVFASLILGAGFLATLPQSNVCRAVGSIGMGGFKVTATVLLTTRQGTTWFPVKPAERRQTDKNKPVRDHFLIYI